MYNMLYMFYRNKIVAKIYLFNDLKKSNDKFSRLTIFKLLFFIIIHDH